MYALLGKMSAVEGKADELAEILIAGIANMLGCLSYVVAKHNTEDNSLWVTEVWEDSSKSPLDRWVWRAIRASARRSGN